MRSMRLIILLAMLLGMAWLSGIEIGLMAESLPGLGEVECFAMYGDYAIFGGGLHNLQVLDMRDPENMEIVGVLDFTDLGYMTGSSIMIDGGKAYLFYWDGCAIVSLADLRHPVLLNYIDFGNATQSIAVDTNVLYVGSLEGELTAYIRSFSVADPLHPVLLDSLAVESVPIKILCSDGFIVTYGYFYALVINTANPAELQSLGYWGLENGKISVDGHLMVSADNYHAQVFDLNNLSNPPGTVNLNGGWPENSFIRDNRYWFSYHWPDNDTRLMGIDISDPDNPVVCHDDYASDGFVNGMMHSDNWLISKVSAGGNLAWKRILIADLDASPVPQFNYSFEMWGIGPLASTDGLLVGKTRSGQVSILDVGMDGKVEQQRVLGNNFWGFMAVQDGLMFTGYPFRIYNASTCELLSTLELDDNWQLQNIIPAGDQVIVFGEGNSNHWYIIDISDPTLPSIAYRSTEAGYQWRTGVVEGNLLWLGSIAGLQCYDISNITSPQLLYEDMLWVEGYLLRPVRMIKRGEYIYLSTSQDQLASLRVNETGVQEIAIQENNYYHTSSLVPFGDGIIVGGTYMISVMSLADPMHPQEIASAVADSTAEFSSYLDCIAVQDNMILVGTGKQLLTYDGELARMLLSNPTPTTEQKLLVYPNPAVEAANVVCRLNRAGEVRLELYNLRGQSVKSIRQDAAEGYNLLRLELRNNQGKRLAPGVYLLRLRENGNDQLSKILVSPRPK